MHPLLAAVSLLVPDARFLFFVNLLTVVGVVAFAVSVIVVLLRHAYQRRLEEQKLAAVGNATARILHQVKNPLQTILLHAELLQENARALGGPQKELSEAVLGEAERLAAMLNELSQWAAGARRSLALGPQPLHELVRQVARTSAREASARVEAEELAEVVVLADLYYLRQAIENLIRNALEAMSGQPDARLVLAVAKAEGGALLTVSDNGPGIPPERLQEIFQPFVSTKGTGMGLGLAICREIVEGHGGRIDVRSEPGEGTAFRIFLPLSGEPLPESEPLIGLS
jgi:signal transduction histidine kinase